MSEFARCSYKEMGLFRTRKPNVNVLVRRGDVDALVAATGYEDLMPASDGRTVDRGATVRRDAVLALGAMGPEAGAEGVTAALSDPYDQVRIAAIQVLFAREQTTPLAAALAWLPKHHGHARALAIKALAQLRRPDSAPALTAALVLARGDDPIDEDDATLLTLLLEADEGSDTAAEVVEQLLVALADESEAVSERAEELLTLIAPTSIQGLITELQAGAAPHRAAATLGRIRDTRALNPLMDGLLHRDARVRAESATALGELRDPVAVEALIHATRDPDHEVRARAGSALDKLGIVALVVGVSTLVRPTLLEAVADVMSRPAIPEHATDAATDGSPDTATFDVKPLGPGRTARPQGEAAAGEPPGTTNGPRPDGPTEPEAGTANEPTETMNGSAPAAPREPGMADLLERLCGTPEDSGDGKEPRF